MSDVGFEKMGRHGCNDSACSLEVARGSPVALLASAHVFCVRTGVRIEKIKLRKKADQIWYRLSGRHNGSRKNSFFVRFDGQTK